MKKLFTTSMLILATLCVSAQSNQKIIFDDNHDFSIRATHPDFSLGGNVQLFNRSENYDNHEVTFTFYDDTFEKQREWTIPGFTVNYYTQMYDAEITGYNVEQNGEDNVYMVYNHEEDRFGYFDNTTGDYIDVSGPLTIDNARRYIAERYGGTILNEETTSEGTFFYISYFGTEGGGVTRSRVQRIEGIDATAYPSRWYWLNTEGSLLFVERNYRVTPIVGDNYVEGEKSEYSYKYNYLRPYFYDYDAPYEMEGDVRITQTLFNDDAKFEYIRPLVTDGLIEVYSGMRDYYDQEIGMGIERPYISETYGGRTTGFQVVSEDGTVLQTINFDGNFIASRYSENVDLIRIHGKVYLQFDGYVFDEPNNTMRDATLIYSIDPSTNQIRKVMEQVGQISVSPRVADRNSQITVEIGNDRDIREIQVVNTAGQAQMRIPVQQGQRSVTIPASQLSRGMNVVNAIGSRSHQSQKVIIR
ncbi:MAG: hypothetical protein IJT98_09685 [Prevotella sp.]|nr:hypothetical protein [Prevotella sp.]